MVTGAAGGIGNAIAGALADSLSAQGIHADLHSVGFDMTDDEALLARVAETEQRLGGIDVLVNNAGIQLRARLLEFPRAGWDSVLATDLTSCFVLAQTVARGMVARGHGKIINICSVQNSAVRVTTVAYAVVGRTPARRWGTAADLGGPAARLASGASDFVNGQIIYIDGGMSAVL